MIKKKAITSMWEAHRQDRGIRQHPLKLFTLVDLQLVGVKQASADCRLNLHACYRSILAPTPKTYACSGLSSRLRHSGRHVSAAPTRTRDLSDQRQILTHIIASHLHTHALTQHHAQGGLISNKRLSPYYLSLAGVRFSFLGSTTSYFRGMGAKAGVTPYKTPNELGLMLMH